MKATELRIGNWVRIKDVPTTNEWQVESIGDLQQVAGQLWSIEELEPIPLTEEWFERFGFERDDKLEKLENNGIVQWKYGDSGTSSFFRVCFHNEGKYTSSYRGTPLTKPKHVHQLQNLYFALTGEELTKNK